MDQRIRKCFLEFINVSSWFIKVVTAGVKLSDSQLLSQLQSRLPRLWLGTGNNQVGQGTPHAWTFQFHSDVVGGRWTLITEPTTCIAMLEEILWKCNNYRILKWFCKPFQALFTNPAPNKFYDVWWWLDRFLVVNWLGIEEQSNNNIKE